MSLPMIHDVIDYVVIDYDVINYDIIRTEPIKSCSDLLKDSGHKSAVDGSDQEARDEESTRDTSTIRPAGNEVIDHKHDAKSGESEGTCECVFMHLDICVCVCVCVCICVQCRRVDTHTRNSNNIPFW